jgi:hypothetical protein
MAGSAPGDEGTPAAIALAGILERYSRPRNTGAHDEKHIEKIEHLRFSCLPPTA